MSGARLLAWRGRREDQEQHLSCDELLARVSVQNPLADTGLIRTAHAEAVRWHQGQMRHSGAPVSLRQLVVAGQRGGVTGSRDAHAVRGQQSEA
jgi:(p)ppGpp synthase/HD superfamily hydrolase